MEIAMSFGVLLDNQVLIKFSLFQLLAENVWRR